jgi:tetratricopeptide (TPR) repeat protein
LELYSDIAQLVAAEIKATVTPEEKQLIEKIPTTSLTAYDFYQRGREEYLKFAIYGDREGLERAEDLYYKALKYDSTFARAFTGLANIYCDKHYWEEYFSESFMDSVLILTNIALSYDNQLAEAYNIRGLYYQSKGLIIQEIKEYDKAIKFNPNDWMAYNYKATYYIFREEDLVKGIDNAHKALSLTHESELKISLLADVCWTYTVAGFPEKAKYYAQEAFKLSGDTAVYNSKLGWIEYYFGNFEKVNTTDSFNYAKNLEFLGECCLMNGQYEESLKYFKKWIEVIGDPVKANTLKTSWIGYDYWIKGDKEEAEYYFNRVFKFENKVTEGPEGREKNLGHYLVLAGVYAFKGEKDKAIENLKIYNQKQRMSFTLLFYIKNDPLFDSLRDEPEFQHIVTEMEVKYQAEHERVRKWLEEQGML